MKDSEARLRFAVIEFLNATPTRYGKIARQKLLDVLYPEAAPAPATRLCPVKHGAEHEMDLVWYCETCGHREAT